tara:strand:- start:52 stop:570 length:519 start_codon:yes stop_codon:yes gene_type:complete
MKQYKSMRGASVDLAKLMAKAEKTISVGNTQSNARGDQLGRGGRVVKSAADIAREHYNQNNPRATVNSTIKVDNQLDASGKTKIEKPMEDDWVEPTPSSTYAETVEKETKAKAKPKPKVKATPVERPEGAMTEDEEYANAGISKDAAESSGEKSDDEWVEDAEGNFVRKDKK